MPNWQEIVDQDGKAVWQAIYRIVGNGADADECRAPLALPRHPGEARPRALDFRKVRSLGFPVAHQLDYRRQYAHALRLRLEGTFSHVGRGFGASLAREARTTRSCLLLAEKN